MRYICYLFFFVIATSCVNSNVRNDSATIDQDSVDYSTRIEKYQTEKLIWRRNLFGLDETLAIEDSFEIRIWIDVVIMKSPLIMYRLKQLNGKWTCLQYTGYIQNREDVVIDSIKNHEFYKMTEVDSIIVRNCGKPNSGWTSFFNCLDFSHLSTLENQIKLEKYKKRKCDVDDGTVYSLEIITPYTYRVLNYHCPYIYSECVKDKSIIFVRDIIELMHTEFPMFENLEILQWGKTIVPYTRGHKC